ncbi:NADH:ubiquinone reductase (Na(+)-transporting) subunit C, partial [Thermodesulfobacteriota bacterium]
EQVILPVRGKGLWSTMYGYVALSRDLNTINGVTFYQHGETPGLGGEIENANWQGAWRGKKIYTPAGQAAFQVVKGKVQDGTAMADYQVDGISGATLTMKGVSNLMQFWFGEHGFKPFLERFQAQGGIHG